MEIQFIYVPILVCVLIWFLGWVFSGFADGLESIAGNPVTLLFSGIGYLLGYLSGLFCLVYYPYKLLEWIYNNITII
jgi:hypothetical protein